MVQNGRQVVIPFVTYFPVDFIAAFVFVRDNKKALLDNSESKTKKDSNQKEIPAADISSGNPVKNKKVKNNKTDT